MVHLFLVSSSRSAPPISSFVMSGMPGADTAVVTRVPLEVVVSSPHVVAPLAQLAQQLPDRLSW